MNHNRTSIRIIFRLESFIGTITTGPWETYACFTGNFNIGLHGIILFLKNFHLISQIFNCIFQIPNLNIDTSHPRCSVIGCFNRFLNAWTNINSIRCDIHINSERMNSAFLKISDYVVDNSRLLRFGYWKQIQ